jgi:hypothetical protein
VAIGKLSVS